MPQLTKIVHVIDSSSRIGVALVSLTTFMFLKFFLRQPLMTAILNIIRIACNTSVPKLPISNGPRIYLACVFFFALTIVSIYQGKLAALLTKHVPLPNINSFDDLADSDRMIYGSSYLTSFFTDSAFDGRLVVIDKLQCSSYLLKDFSGVCVNDRSYLLSLALKLNLYVSNEDIVKFSMVHVVRHDWPLENRVNLILSRLTEAHIIYYRYEQERLELLPVELLYEATDEEQSAKVLTLNEVAFSFAILGIGLGCATLSFIVEVGLEKLNK